jgi:dCMP deaminase
MDWNEYFMRLVYLTASKSKDPRTKIGAVLVKDNRIISTGFNGFPYNVDDNEERYNHRDTKLKFIVHGEDNAILQCALLGHSTKDSTLYTQGIPCNECAKSVIQAGVKKVVYHTQWPLLTNSISWVEACKISSIMLEEAGVKVEDFNQELGLKGWLDSKEIDV